MFRCVVRGWLHLRNWYRRICVSCAQGFQTQPSIAHMRKATLLLYHPGKDDCLDVLATLDVSDYLRRLWSGCGDEEQLTVPLEKFWSLVPSKVWEGTCLLADSASASEGTCLLADSASSSEARRPHLAVLVDYSHRTETQVYTAVYRQTSVVFPPHLHPSRLKISRQQRIMEALYSWVSSQRGTQEEDCFNTLARLAGPQWDFFVDVPSCILNLAWLFHLIRQAHHSNDAYLLNDQIALCLRNNQRFVLLKPSTDLLRPTQLDQLDDSVCQKPFESPYASYVSVPGLDLSIDHPPAPTLV